MPLAIFMFYKIRDHYDKVAGAITLAGRSGTT